VISGLGRLNGEQGEEFHDSPSNYGFGLYETVIDLVALGFAQRTLASIKFHKPNNASTTGIFAVSGQSAELSTGVHVSWESEAESEILDVSTSANGPWISIGRGTQVVGDRELVVVDSGRLPQFYRSTQPEFDRLLLSQFDFGREGRDRMRANESLEIDTDIEFPEQTMFVPKGSGVRARAEVSRLNYNNFTVSLDFQPLEIEEEGEQNILIGGSPFSWIRLFTLNGRLAISLNNEREWQVIDDAELLAGQWHRLIFSVNIQTELVELLLDGKQLEPIDLGEGFGYDRASSEANDMQRSLFFGDLEASAAFSGYVDNLMVFRRALTGEDLIQIHRGLEPKSLVSDFGHGSEVADGFTTGFHVSWESNLEGFGLERAESPVGPWSSVEPLEPSFDGRRVSIMDMQGETAIYRLRNPQ
jgi:hypothetical protein